MNDEFEKTKEVHLPSISSYTSLKMLSPTISSNNKRTLKTLNADTAKSYNTQSFVPGPNSAKAAYGLEVVSRIHGRVSFVRPAKLAKKLDLISREQIATIHGESHDPPKRQYGVEHCSACG